MAFPLLPPNPSLTRRQFLKNTAAMLGAFALPATPTPLLAKTPPNGLKIGYLPITDAAPLLIAHANGFFKEEGLAVAEPILIRNWSALSESFLAGKFNVTHMLFPIPIWMRYNKRVPIKILAWDHTNGSALTVRADSGITGFKDLGGKRIAVPYWYSIHNIILQAALHYRGLKPVIRKQARPLKPDEVNLFILPPPAMPPALAGKKIDGFIVAEPFNAISEIKLGAKIMRFTGDIWQNHPCCVIVMLEEIIRGFPVFTQKVIHGIVRAQLWINKNPLQAAHILSREGKRYLPVSEKVLINVFTHYDAQFYGPQNHQKAILHPEWGCSRIGFQPYPFSSATRFILNQMGQTLMEGDTSFLKRLDAEFALKDLVDDVFVKKSIQALGGPEKFGILNSASPWEREEVIAI